MDVERKNELVQIGYACRNGEITLDERIRRVDSLFDQITSEDRDWLSRAVDGRKPKITRLLALLSGDEARIKEALAEINPPQVVSRVERHPSAKEIQDRVRYLAERRRKQREREHERGKIPLRSSYEK